MDRVAKGFTLIELLIAVAIMGIVMAIALPSYQYYVVKSRRADAKTALMTIAQLQESYFADNNTYATGSSALQDLGIRQEGFRLEGGKYLSKDGYYELKFDKALANYFVIQAIPVEPQKTSEEEYGKRCYTFALDSRGIKSVVYSKDGADDCWN